MTLGTTVAGQRTRVGADGLHARAICGHSAFQPVDTALIRPPDATQTVIGGALGSAGSALFTFTDFFEAVDSHSLLTQLRLTFAAAGIAVPSGIGVRAHLFNADVSAAALSVNADKGTYRELAAHAGVKLGTVDFTSFQSGGAGSDLVEGYGAPAIQPLHLKASATGRALYALLVATTAFAPPAGAAIGLIACRSSL